MNPLFQTMFYEGEICDWERRYINKMTHFVMPNFHCHEFREKVIGIYFFVEISGWDHIAFTLLSNFLSIHVTLFCICPHLCSKCQCYKEFKTL